MLVQWPTLEPLRWRDAYDPDVAYLRNDLVYDSGSTYRAAVDVPAGVSLNDPRWLPAALAGEAGADGDTSNAPAPVGIPFSNLVLAGGFTAFDNTAPPQIGMDVSGAVYLRGRIRPATGGSQLLLTTIANLVLRPDRLTRIPVARVNGDTPHLVIAANGQVHIDTIAGTDFHIDASFPSGVAFGDARYRKLELDQATPDPDSPLRSVGNRLVGSIRVTGPTVDLLNKPLAHFAEGTPIAKGERWHFTGSGTYQVVGGGSGSGTVTVDSNDSLAIASFTPAVASATAIRVTFAPPGLTVTP